MPHSNTPHNPPNPPGRHHNSPPMPKIGFPKSLGFVYPQYILDFQVPLKLSKREVRYLVLWSERQRGMASVGSRRNEGGPSTDVVSSLRPARARECRHAPTMVHP